MANKSTTAQKHPYHLVDPSPLPFLSSIAGLAMAAGLVFYMHYGTSWLLIVGTIGLLTIMFLWWRDVIKESTFQKVHVRYQGCVPSPTLSADLITTFFKIIQKSQNQAHSNRRSIVYLSM